MTCSDYEAMNALDDSCRNCRQPMLMHKFTQANQRQIGGKHYKNMSRSGLEHWDIVDDFGLDYFQGQITKYVMRWRNKQGVQDLEKAAHFLQKYIEVERSRETNKAGMTPDRHYVDQDERAK